MLWSIEKLWMSGKAKLSRLIEFLGSIFMEDESSTNLTLRFMPYLNLHLLLFPLAPYSPGLLPTVHPLGTLKQTGNNSLEMHITIIRLRLTLLPWSLLPWLQLWLFQTHIFLPGSKKTCCQQFYHFTSETIFLILAIHSTHTSGTSCHINGHSNDMDSKYITDKKKLKMFDIINDTNLWPHGRSQ